MCLWKNRLGGGLSIHIWQDDVCLLLKFKGEARGRRNKEARKAMEREKRGAEEWGV